MLLQEEGREVSSRNFMAEEAQTMTAAGQGLPGSEAA